MARGSVPASLTYPCPPSQLVAGIKYYLTVEMGSTACRKSAVTGDRMDLTTCPLAAGPQEEVRALRRPCPPAPGPSGCPAGTGLAGQTDVGLNPSLPSG